MSKIYFIAGKSSSGKDTLFSMLIQSRELNLKNIVSYTTRPIREGEENGREYYFVDVNEMNRLEKEGKVIERRTYHTVNGDWHYFLVDDGQVELGTEDYLVIGTLESYEKVRNYYGKDVVCPLYIEIEDGIRLERALAREKFQKKPNYLELCRRFIADAEDFSEEEINRLGIKKRYINENAKDCFREISEDILKDR